MPFAKCKYHHKPYLIDLNGGCVGGTLLKTETGVLGAMYAVA